MKSPQILTNLDSSSLYVQESQRDFDSVTADWRPALFKQNLTVIAGVLSAARATDNSGLTSDAQPILKNLLYPIGTSETIDLSNFTREYINSPDVSETLHEQAPELTPVKAVETPNIDKPFVCLTGSHEQTFAEITYLLKDNENIPLHEVGVMIYDTHLDSDAETSNKTLSKANFIDWLLKYGISVGLLGIPKNFCGLIEKRDLPILTAKSTRSLKGNYEQTHQHGFIQSDIDEIVYLMAQNGVRHITHSVDLDCINPYKNEMTATAYNQINILRMLGSNDLMKRLIATSGFNFLRNTKPNKNAIRTELTQRLNRTNISTWIDAVSKVLTTYEDGKESKPVLLQGTAFGLGPEDIINGIQFTQQAAQHNNISMGLPNTNGGIYLGEVTELNGKDLGGKTARIALDIADAILSNH